MSVQCNFVRSQQPREMLAPKKRVFVFALDRQRVEADQGFVDEPWVTHDEAILRKLIEKLSHQHAEIGLLRKIIGTGEARIECDIGARGAATKLRAQNGEKQRLGRAEPPEQRRIASALANPGVGRSFLYRRQERIAHYRKQLRMLMTVDEIRGAAKQFVESRELRHQFCADDFRIERV